MKSPATRGTVALVADVMLEAAGMVELYPEKPIQVPSGEMDNAPSAVELPAVMSFVPLPVAGIAIDCTSTPAVVYSSRKTLLPVRIARSMALQQRSAG